MSKGNHSFIPTHICLISKLVDHFVAKNTRDFSEYTILLPTLRLGTRFIANLTQKLGAIRPPAIG